MQQKELFLYITFVTSEQKIIAKIHGKSRFLKRIAMCKSVKKIPVKLDNSELVRWILLLGFGYRGQILGHNWDKSFKSFTVTSNNGFYPPPPPPSKRGLKSLKTLKIMPRKLNKIARSWVRLLDTQTVFCVEAFLYFFQCRSFLNSERTVYSSYIIVRLKNIAVFGIVIQIC